MSTTTNTSTENAEKKDFSIADLMLEHEKFEHISDSKFVSSSELCSVISGVFANVYSDYEGCNFEFLPGSNVPTITLFFNHKNEIKTIDGVQLPFACSKEDTENRAINNTLRSTRNYSSRLVNGDRYFLTDEGNGLKDFIIDNAQFYRKDGSVVWSKLVSEVADGNFNVPMQYTQVKCLDPAKLVELIYGKKDSDGISWVYGVRVMRSIPSYTMITGMSTSGYMLAIERVSQDEVEKLARQFGLNASYGLNIIR